MFLAKRSQQGGLLKTEELVEVIRTMVDSSGAPVLNKP